MGCFSSRPFIEDTTRPIFHVWNIDDQGKYIKSCHIQVTDTELVLHQRGEPPIVWPLKSLRRYGFDSHLFSFECGRRCTTGPGIYAFKCRKAESLFNVLQECVQASQLDNEQGVDGADGVENGALPAPPDSQEVSTSNGPVVVPMRGEQLHRASDTAFEPQPSSSGVSDQRMFPPAAVIPTAPNETVSSPTSPLMTAHSFSHRHSGAYRSARMLRRATEFVSPKMLPRCCTIGTCINPASWHGNTKDALRNTTCGSCRTCSLNMCVVLPDANTATDSFNRARQADYGNVLDPDGHPRQCVHCCCGFKPNTQIACSADNCPLHFNNSVDQITNYDYARLDDRVKEHAGRTLKKEKHQHYQQIPLQPVTHLYMNMDTPTKKWHSTSFNKNASWRSLPHFGKMSSLNRLAPKRSTSHFYANMVDNHYDSAEKKPHRTQPVHHESRLEATTTGDDRTTEPSQPTNVNYIMLDLEQSPESCAEASSPMSSSSNHAEINHNSPIAPKGDASAPGYATIDFDKTVALSNSTNSNAVEDESVRRTRHNGSMSSAGTQTS